MKIKAVRIQNFRSFQNQTIEINKYTCFVGPNGAGKSNVLAALNVFFKEQSASPTDVGKLAEEDWFNKNTSQPIRITVTFDDLDERAQDKLKDYFRQGELVVTAQAVYDPEAGYGQVVHTGQRLGFEVFRPYFEADKRGEKAVELRRIFGELRGGFPGLEQATSKSGMEDALHAYEAAHSDQCILIESEDNFYGINSTGKLSQFIQWVCVPAVKDAGEEAQEAKNTSLGRLVERAVRTRVNFDDAIGQLRAETLTKYQELLDQQQDSLTEISVSLQRRLAEWAHPDVRLGVEWVSDPAKSVQLQQPVAGIRTGEGEFLGSLSRMGHGLQRSYLLALLQELAGSDHPEAPTLLLGCEEPELYQHPPQARHLADVLRSLADGNNQVLLTTHSPLFVSGEDFEDVRLIRRPGSSSGSSCRSVALEAVRERIRVASGGAHTGRPIQGLVAKIHQTLQSQVAEMFFSRLPVLVEGLEDCAYITAQLHLSGKWQDFRRLGCHLVPVNGKDKLIQPLAIAMELGLPAFVMFDADGDEERPDRRGQHEKDNRTLLSQLGSDSGPFPPGPLWGENYVVWSSNLTSTIKAEVGDDYESIADRVRVTYAQEKNLGKNVLFIADLLTAARQEGHECPSLSRVCDAILEFASKESGR